LVVVCALCLLAAGLARNLREQASARRERQASPGEVADARL